MKNRRKQLVVDGNFQYRLILIGVLVSFTLINTTLLIGFFVSDRLIFNASPKVVYSITVVLTEICCLIAVFFLSLRSSHLMAGPLYQVKQSLKKIGEGDLTISTQLREKDYFQDVGIQLNHTTEQLCESVRRIKETARTVVSQLDDDSMATEPAQRLCSQLAELKTHSDRDDMEPPAHKVPSLELVS